MQRPLAHPVPVENAYEGDFDLVGHIMEYEGGYLDDDGALRLYAHLIKTGMAWRLQGFYGRAAAQLIQQGLISPEGDIL